MIVMDERETLTWRFGERRLRAPQGGQEVGQSELRRFEPSRLLRDPHAGLVLDPIDHHAEGKIKPRHDVA